MLKAFSKKVTSYDRTRDYPAILGTSGLSAHFRFGTLSTRQAVQFCFEHFAAGTKVWLNELIWREFYQMILDQFPHVVNGAFKPEYDKIKWSNNPKHFKAWCEGRTGYPLVDAAMRQLNETGWMHNRLRMVTAMFLTKDLMLDWREGARYFAEQLLDHELAANNGGWQWSASTGCDAQPYFRVMNPVSQSEKFDADGDFIRKFVPELKKLDAKIIHWPHEEPGLFSSGLNGYPEPLVDHSVQRVKAIALFKK
jgi:deoxyribodipyrimidine photo-lyase